MHGLLGLTHGSAPRMGAYLNCLCLSLLTCKEGVILSAPASRFTEGHLGVPGRACMLSLQVRGKAGEVFLTAQGLSFPVCKVGRTRPTPWEAISRGTCPPLFLILSEGRARWLSLQKMLEDQSS